MKKQKPGLAQITKHTEPNLLPLWSEGYFFTLTKITKREKISLEQA